MNGKLMVIAINNANASDNLWLLVLDEMQLKVDGGSVSICDVWCRTLNEVVFKLKVRFC